MRSDNLAKHQSSRGCKIRCNICFLKVPPSEFAEHELSHQFNLNINVEDSLSSLESDSMLKYGEVDEKITDIYTTFQKHIETSSFSGKIVSQFNFRTDNISNMELSYLFKKVYSEQKNVFKVNISLGYILQNKVTGEYGYYGSSQNNQTFFKKPRTVRNSVDRRVIMEDLEGIDLINLISRPHTKWIFFTITNITFFVYTLDGVPIGSPTRFPEYLRKNKGLHSLISNCHGMPYRNSKCFFRCLALFQGAKLQSIEKPAKELLKTYSLLFESWYCRVYRCHSRSVRGDLQNF